MTKLIASFSQFCKSA